MSQVESRMERVAQVEDGGQGRRASRRRQVDSILEAARFVHPDDQLLLRQALEFGLSIGDIARLMRCSRSVIYRRIRTTLGRIRSPLFAYAAQNRRGLDPGLRQVADLVVLQGRTQREASLATSQSLHQVRKHLHALATLAAR